MRSIKPEELSIKVRHQYLLGAVGPRPIAFASTLDANNISNLAPFSFFNVFSSNPPIAVFSPARRGRDNTTKDTLENVKNHPEVVINIVSYPIVQQMAVTSSEYDVKINEFEKGGFTQLGSERIKPFRVKESPVQMECKVNEVVSLGDKGAAGNMVICEMVMMHIHENILDSNEMIDQEKVDQVGRMGGSWYTRAHGDALFQLPKPFTELGVGMDNMPKDIKHSEVLSGNDLGKLANVDHLPDETAVNDYRLTELSDLFMKYEDDAKTLEKVLHQKAKSIIDEGGDLNEAWKVLLSFNN
ncbi:MAG: flavin reductase family protein [Flavobacteriales bacterium]